MKAKISTKFLQLTIVFVSVVFLVFAVFPMFLYEKSPIPLPSLLERLHNNKVDGEIEFYGRVVDHRGFPVKGVSILVSLRRFGYNLRWFNSKSGKFHIKTDINGYFTIMKNTGFGLSFYEFKKNGYEFIHDDVPISFNFQKNTTGIHRPDPNNPVTYRMRKKGEETYIVRPNGRVDCFRYDAKESGSRKAYDFIIGSNIPEHQFDNPMAGHVPLVIDLKTKAVYNPKSNKWRIELSPGNPDGGILVSPEKLYVAPEAGYMPSLIIEPDDFIGRFDLESNDKPRHLSKGHVYIYLKSRTPAIYSRFVITHILMDEKSIEMSASGYATNPYGDRNLEAATDLPSAIRDKLWQEVRDCYINGRRPQKPNLPKMIEDFESQGSRWGR